MILTTTNRRHDTDTTLPDRAGSSQPWAVAIRERYGDLPALAGRFSPKSQKYCARNMQKAIESGLPSLGRIVATYGEKGVSALIATHITEAILRMGEDRDVDTYDVQFIAEAICEGARYRALRFTTVIGFFHLLKCGEFDIYGKVTPRKILEAFRKYSEEAAAKETRILEEHASRELEAARAERAATAKSWDKYAESRNIKDASLSDYIARQIREETERIQLWRYAANIGYTFRGLISFIHDWLTNSPESAGNAANSASDARGG